MDAAESYVRGLNSERTKEMARREQRRRYRNEFLAHIEKKRTARSLERLRGDLWQRVSMTSSMEENLLNVVCRTTKWWEMLCKHSVDQRLQLEHAEENRVIQQEDYLNHVHTSEQREAESILSSDQRRWQTIQETHEQQDNDARMAAVSGALDVIFRALDRSIDYVESFAVAPSRVDPLITFVLQDVIKSEIDTALSAQRLSQRRASRSAVSVRKAQAAVTPREPPSTAEVARDAFRALFGQSPFCCSSAAPPSVHTSDSTSGSGSAGRESNFSCLVAYYYHTYCPPRATPSIYDSSQVPVFVVSGPKLSGKSILCTFLQDKFGFQAVGPLDLVQRAMRALEDQEDERERVESDLPPDSSEHAWAALGRRVRAVLQNGGAVGADLIAELLTLKLADAQREAYNGLILDGLLGRPDEYDALCSALIPAVARPFPALSAYMRHGTDATSLDLPEPWRMPRLVVEDAPSKKEQKTRGNKKAGDASALPPVVLPELEDVSASIVTEQAFIAKAERDLRKYSGIFSRYVRIDCSPREVFKRFAGLRVDSETGEEYHMTYRPPPQDRMPFLVNPDRTGVVSAHLHALVFAQDQQWKCLEAHLRRYQPTARHIVHLEGECTVEALCGQGESVAKETLEEFVAGQRLFLDARDAKDRVHRLEEQHARQLRAREDERLRLVALYEERNVPLPPELLPTEETADFYPVPHDLPNAILSIAAGIVEQYGEDYAWGWTALRDGAQLLLQYQQGCESSMSKFWGGPDDKQETLDRFIQTFNATPSALRCKPGCKDDLHRYIGELSDALYVQVDRKQRDCVTRMQQLTRREAFLEGWQAMMANAGAFLVQAEAERFVVTLNAILLHFAALMSEPLHFEDFEMDASLMNLMTSELTPASAGNLNGAGGADGAPAAPATRAGRDGRKAASVKKTGHSKSTDEVPEHAVEDAFNEIVQRLTTALEGLVDKVRDTAEPNAKSLKKAAVPNAGRLVALAARCLGPLEVELAGTVSRVSKVKSFVGELLRRGEQHSERMKAELQSSSRARFVAQASSVNTAVYVLRNCVEQEVQAPPMHLGCGTFAVLGDAPVLSVPLEKPGLTRMPVERSFLTDVPLYGHAQATYKALVHPTLSVQRLLELVRYFRGVAPNFQLSRNDFCLVVREGDYGGAALEGESLRSVPAVFDAFDSQGVGLIDWRELIVHLLFWCCAPPSSSASAAARTLYIKEPTVEQLLETKGDVGLFPVNHDTFLDLPFFYDDVLEEERLEGYTTALWLTFEDPETHLLDPFQLLWCLCADSQPIRGAQKAFYLLSSAEEGRLDVSELHHMFHASATNAPAVGKPDPFAEPYLQLLVGDAATVSFAEACVSVMGRKLLNSADMFRRRRFTTSKKE